MDTKDIGKYKLCDNNSILYNSKNKEKFFDKSKELALRENKVSIILDIPEIEVHSIDLDAIWIVSRLKMKGFNAYLTGGCVRDLLLGRKPKDFDVVTNAKPEEINFLFRNCRLIGRRFLLAHIFFPGGKIIETATFRANPVEFAKNSCKDLLVTEDNVFGTIREDAYRRDFTINALFYDPINQKGYDFVGAKQDLEDKVIRMIGDPNIRLREDPVRILRAIKFASRLKLQIEEHTLIGMKAYVGELLKCAPSRLQEELIHFLTSGSSLMAIKLCRNIGVLDILMPELNSDLKIVDNIDEKINKLDERLLNRYKEIDKVLEVLDNIYMRRCYISSAVAFSAVLLPIYKAFKTSSNNEVNWLDKLCINWAKRIRLTKRNQEKIKQLLSSVLLMSSNLMDLNFSKYLIKQNWFREALLLNIINLIFQNKSLESIVFWKNLAEKHNVPYKQEKHRTKRRSSVFKRRKNSRKRLYYKMK